LSLEQPNPGPEPPTPPQTGGERSSASVREPLHPKPATPAPEEPAKKQRSDLGLRLITAAFLIPVVIWVIVYGSYPYVAVVLAFGLLAQYEFYRLIEDKGARPMMGLGIGFGAAVMGTAYYSTGHNALLLMTFSLLVLMVAQLRKAQITEALASISGTFFGVFYVAWLLSHAIMLRFFFDGSRAFYDDGQLLALELHPGSGIFFMIFCLATVIGCDAGAYFAGRAWGRRKLAPEISPNKSVEGALGGIVFGTLCGVIGKLSFDLFWPELSAALVWEAVIPFGIVLCVVGIIGDLVESLLKRDADVKDTGALLPGMGGVLDRIDAPLLALPMMYYLLIGYCSMRLA
jgi:phosphatidate cytidylyltransferase